MTVTVQNAISTMVNQMDTTFRWTVKQFDMWPQLPGKRLFSPEFNVGTYKFRLSLIAKVKDANYIGVHFKRLDDCRANEVSITYELYVTGDKGLCVCIHKSTDKLVSGNNSWEWDTAINREFLATSKKRKLLTSNILTTEFKIVSLFTNEVIKDESHLYNKEDCEILSRDFGDLLKKGTHSDLTILADDSKFNVHRAVLEVRCPQLMAQLKVSDEALNEYHFPGIVAPVLKMLLQYVYAGTFRMCNMYKEVFMLSNKYGIPNLRSAFEFSHPKSISASTELNVSHMSFKWIIPNFSSLQLDQELVYPAFYSGNDWDKIEVILSITQMENGSNDLQLKFRRMCTDIVVLMRCTLSILKTDSLLTVVIVKEYEHIFKQKKWIATLGMKTDVSKIIFNDTLTMYFEIAMSNNEEYSKIERVSVNTKIQNLSVEYVKNLELLQRDFQTLFYRSKFADVFFYVDDEKYFAHKAILCARSPVFAKMFEHTSEKEEVVVVIEDMDSDTVASVLKYVYYNCIDELNFSDAIKMFAAADKFQLLAFKEKCRTFLKSYIDVDHVGEILLLADAHQDEILKRYAYDYIESNPKKVMLSETGLSVLNGRLDLYPNILKELLAHIAAMNKRFLDKYLSDAIRMYPVADKNQLLDRKERLVTFIKSSMNADYLSEILLLADEHHDEDLKRCAFDYMISNPKQVLLSKNGLNKLNDKLDMCPDILKELLAYISSKKEKF